MPFKFTALCDLLESLECIELRDPPYLRDKKAAETRKAVLNWFNKHRKTIDAPDSNGVAILSTLFPERRTDRVYAIQALRLQKLAARCLRLTTKKAKELEGWKTAGNGDLGACIERVQKDYNGAPLPGPLPLSVEEVDSALASLASKVRFSSPEARRNASAAETLDILTPLYLKVHSREAKWLTRLILKDFGRVVLDQNLVFREYHFMLPALLKFQDKFSAAIAYLKGPLRKYHSKPDPQSQGIFFDEASLLIKPQIGVKIGKPNWHKARSMANCLNMVGQGTWLMERKYDGEYCEIHVDLSKGANCIQIFSKVGKDATADRSDLLPIIKKCLRIGQPECMIKKQCILLGEMVVYSDLEERVLEFHKIRKHVSRSGSFLGNIKDSQKHSHEHLMIVFFDVLLLDDNVVMAKPVKERRESLTALLTKIRGRAVSSEWMLVDFSKRGAESSLMYQFSAALAFRCEGLILKPNAPYFSLRGENNGSWCRGFIKLKKDYMADMGGDRDVADFAIIGAGYDAQQAQKTDLKFLKWTNFYLGCLTSKEDLRSSGRPTFKVVGIIKQDQCVPRPELKFLNEHGQFRTVNYDEDTAIEAFNIKLGRNPNPDVLFTRPFVAEVLGSAFDKPPNEDFFMLRHPRILKLHTDRTWEDCITMDGLKDMADEARNLPEEGVSQEILQKVNAMTRKVRMKLDRDSQASRRTTPQSLASTTASPELTRQNQRQQTVDASVSPRAVGRAPRPLSDISPLRKVAARNAATDGPRTLEPIPESQISTQDVTQQSTQVTLSPTKRAPSRQPAAAAAAPTPRKGPRKPLAEISPPSKNRRAGAQRQDFQPAVSISAAPMRKQSDSENVKIPASTAPPNLLSTPRKQRVFNVEDSPRSSNKRERCDDWDVGFDSPRKQRCSVFGLRDLARDTVR